MKKILLILLVIVLAGAGIGIYQWNKPHKTVDSEKGIPVQAKLLFSEFSSNEQAANKKYLNKALEVTGEVATVDQNQDKQKYIVLKTDDAFNGVMCTMRDSNQVPAVGQTVTVKGFCSGFTSDVKLTDCMLPEAGK